MARSAASAPCTNVPISTTAAIDTTASVRLPSISTMPRPTTRAQNPVSEGTNDRLFVLPPVLSAMMGPLPRS
jgi:hypothetical protein